MRLPVFPLLLLFEIIVLGGHGIAQEQSDQAAEIAQLFGQGSGIDGVVTSAAAGAFIIRTDEGTSYKVYYSPNTHLVKDRQPIGSSDVHPGDELVAVGQLDRKAKTIGAVFLFDVDAAQVRKARAGFGKNWMAGKVTAIHDLRITIDSAIEAQEGKQTQIIAVDENTSFREHNQSITLGDIKVGDFINVQGAMNDKIFLATVLRVMDPNAVNNQDFRTHEHPAIQPCGWGTHIRCSPSFTEPAANPGRPISDALLRQMWKRRMLIAWLCLAASLYAPSQAAQSAAPAPATAVAAKAPATEGGGLVHGTVKSGNVPLPGVTVTASNTLTGQKYATTTDIHGNYSMNIPASGRYVIKADLAAFALETREELLKQAGAMPVSLQEDFSLMLASRAAPPERRAAW